MSVDKVTIDVSKDGWQYIHVHTSVCNFHKHQHTLTLNFVLSSSERTSQRSSSINQYFFSFALIIMEAI